MSDVDHRVAAVTARIVERSRPTRAAYLDLIARERDAGVHRPTLACGNLAHGFAAAGEDKAAIRGGRAMNLAIVTAYNDMLSAHQPYGRYPEQMKLFAREAGATAQVAGGVPAMCDGVTQGQPGMELSLFSRDVIALSTAIGLSHGMFEGAALLGICDKIVPGLLIGALRFGHLPVILIPAGPMPSGLANKEKQRVRQLHAEGKVGEAELLDAEAASYHGAGTCTFYGTANSNQMMMEVMGLHVPGAAFVNPGTALRQALTRAAVHRLAKIAAAGNDYRPLGRCIDERAVVNAAVGLLATGGSTNHAIHIPAIARAAGIVIDWSDIDALSDAVPLIARIYPNGSGDVNHFQAAGGMAFVIATLLEAGLLHQDILTVWHGGLASYATEPTLPFPREGGSPANRNAVLPPSREHSDLGSSATITWHPAPPIPRDDGILRPASAPFLADGGMRLVVGNLGRATFKTSAVDPSRWTTEAPARIFADQDEVVAAFHAGELERDVVVVVRFQGPRANGMPELHKLTPPLGVLQDRGHRVALVTDGRMSGASGKIPAAIHLTPEAYAHGPLARLRDGDIVRLCGHGGSLTALVDEAEFAARAPAFPPPPPIGTGRELFAFMRHGADGAEQGGSAMLAAMAGPRVSEIAAVDIGGTHARFAIAEIADGRVVRLDPPLTLATADHAGLEQAWTAFANQLGRPAPRAAAIAVAGPVRGDLVTLTNSHWVIRRSGIGMALDLERVSIINDMVAIGHAVAELDQTGFRHLCGPDRPYADDATISVVGLGTGLGVAQVVRRDGRILVAGSEGGHIAFAPADEVEDALLARLRDRFGRVSIERIVSGPGLGNIAEALSGRTCPDDAALWRTALAGEDPAAAAALDRFCLCLGSVAGDIALVHLARGVALAGSLALRLGDRLATSGLAERFAAKGRFAAMMADVPVKLVIHPQPGLYGAAAAYAREHQP